MKTQQLKRVLSNFRKQRILVVGDVMLDRFLWGKVSRISPEAPVPVVEINRESHFPGGAANVARNLRAFGASVEVLSVVGDDADGQELRHLLAEQGIATTGLISDPNRPTTLKTRIVAQHQQVVRVDREKVDDLSSSIAGKLLEHFATRLSGATAVIFEDYAKGLLSQSRLDVMQRLAFRQRKITTADPNARHLLQFRGLTGVTPNRAEAFAAAGIPSAEPAEVVLQDKALLRVGATLLRNWRPDNLLITLGEHGMCLFRSGKAPHHIPTVAQEVFDVSGAGDTAIATFTLALAARVSALDAAVLANHAAGVVVGKIGTAVCSPEELIQSLARNDR